jgi:hydroxypyruvate reductase
VYALGKAAHPMAAGAVAELQRSLHTIVGGVLVAPAAGPAPHATIAALRGDHPLPARNSFTAAQRIGESATAKRGDDVAVVLVSGGASSLAAAPLRGMSESDLVQLFEVLLGSGLDVRAMNAVRKRFTRWGAGRLAIALAPARTHVLVMSDVIGDDAGDIGSGPCAPDVHTAREVIEVLRGAALLPRIPAAMREYLSDASRGIVPETPKPSHPAFAHVTTRLIGSNRLALDAMVRHARALAVPAEVVDRPLSGEASRCGVAIAEALLARAESGQRGCILWGGETTVRLGADASARGGRCQELALAASRRLAQGSAAKRVTLLAAGTDGRDGPTDAAGAFADGALWDEIVRSGQDPERALARHESYVALDAAGALLRRGQTGTNVMDVVIGVVE